MTYRPVLSCMHRPGPPLDRFVARLWYWEALYPLVFALAGLRAARVAAAARPMLP